MFQDIKFLSPLQAKEVGDVLETLISRDMSDQAIDLIESIFGKVSDTDFAGLVNYVLEFARKRRDSIRYPAKSSKLASDTYLAIKNFSEKL